MASNRDLMPVAAVELRDGDRDGSLMPGRRIVGTPRPLGDGRVELTMRWGNGRTDKARVDADRTFRVKRAVVGPGLPIRYRGKARTTGAVVEVHDTAHPDATVDAATARGHRWALRCTHGTVVGRASLTAAREDVDDPRLWCTSCVDASPRVLTLPL